MRIVAHPPCGGENYSLACRVGTEVIEVGIRGPSFNRALGEFLARLQAEGWETYTRKETGGVIVELRPASEEWRAV